MNAPQFITSPAGEEMVVLPRSEYERLVAIAEEAAEDEADARLAAERLAEIAVGDEALLTAPQSGALLAAGGYLKAARKQLGMTQAELATTTGLAQGFLSDIEAGRRNGAPETMRKLAAALGLPVEQFA